MPEELFLDSTLTASKFESEKWIQLNAEKNELAVSSWGDQSREKMSLSEAKATKKLNPYIIVAYRRCVFRHMGGNKSIYLLLFQIILSMNFQQFFADFSRFSFSWPTF